MTFAPAPAGEANLSRISPTRRASQVVLEGKPWQRVQTTADEPTEWLRLPWDNAGTRLGPPLWLRWHGLAGGRYRLEVPDNDYWTPFDLREIDRYRVFDGLSGAQLEDPARHLELAPGQHWEVYLRPRTWRYVVTVIAHFVNVTPFELVPEDITFLEVFYDRPPFDPIRHEVCSATPSVPNFYGDLRSVDTGITTKFDSSRAAAELRSEIISAQYFSACLAFIFLGNENADITVQRMAPRAGELVAVLARIDTATGKRMPLLVYAREDQDGVYEREVVGQFIAPFDVA